MKQYRITLIADLMCDAIAVLQMMGTSLTSFQVCRHPDSELSELLIILETSMPPLAIRLWLEQHHGLTYLTGTMQARPMNSDQLRENLKTVSRTWERLGVA